MIRSSSQTAVGTPATFDPGRTYRVRIAAYWIATVLVAQERVASSVWALLDIEYIRVNLAHLGYPHYVLNILGIWDFPCAVVLLAPRLGRLKEWAYAGAMFNFSGAVASHLFVGDGPGRWVAPFVFACLTLASWAFRPPERRIVSAGPAPETRTRSWVVPILVLVVMLTISVLTLPKGPP